MEATRADRNWIHVVPLGAAIFLMSLTQSTAADTKLVTRAKALLVIIGSSFDGCYLDLQEANLLDRTSRTTEAGAKLNELSQCIDDAPNQTKRAVDDLRLALSHKPKALATFKDYVLTYRSLLAKLESPSTTLNDAGQFSAILDGKAAKVIAEIEW